MSDFGKLSDYIIGASIKKLSAVECDQDSSNQHELNGTKQMAQYLGKDRITYPASFIRLEDEEEKIEFLQGSVTWYDARENHPTRSEYRFYYQANPAIALSSAGDALAVILKKDGEIIFVSAPQGSQSEIELHELFDESITDSFKSFDFTESNEELTITKRFILEEVGFELNANFGKDYLGIIESKFGALAFPTTKEFSQLARKTSGELADFENVDEAIINWWDTEEAMFKQLEATIINNRLETGFQDADEFLSFSQSIRQRRYARAGRALENHLACIFETSKISFSWGPKTENNKTPDFIFPNIESYKDPDFSSDKLTMLGVKTTCKDRWRQVLTEADRISEKHLFTLQPRISTNQTNEMQDFNLQLVVPKAIKYTYTNNQQNWLWDLEHLINHLRSLQ